MNQLSNEQQLFIDYALAGHNILVEACIGSGKTTAIQALCNRLAGKRVPAGAGNLSVRTGGGCDPLAVPAVCQL